MIVDETKRCWHIATCGYKLLCCENTLGLLQISHGLIIFTVALKVGVTFQFFLARQLLKATPII